MLSNDVRHSALSAARITPVDNLWITQKVCFFAGAKTAKKHTFFENLDIEAHFI